MEKKGPRADISCIYCYREFVLWSYIVAMFIAGDIFVVLMLFCTDGDVRTKTDGRAVMDEPQPTSHVVVDSHSQLSWAISSPCI